MVVQLVAATERSAHYVERGGLHLGSPFANLAAPGSEAETVVVSGKVLDCDVTEPEADQVWSRFGTAAAVVG